MGLSLFCLVLADSVRFGVRADLACEDRAVSRWLCQWLGHVEACEEPVLLTDEGALDRGVLDSGVFDSGVFDRE